jgi:NitT/TauT family transport system substrate-binding protein
MGVRENSWVSRAGFLLALIAAAFGADAAAAQTPVKFTLNWKFEGQSAAFVFAQDKGYYAARGLEVTIDPAASSLESLSRIASGSYDMGVADINELVKFRDQNPNAALTAVFIVYNKAAFSIVGRRSRGVTVPLDLEGKKLGAPANDLAFVQWPIFAKANGITMSKVTIVNVGPPIREPMLASGELDAITGFSFTSYVNLKDRGVLVDDITVLLMADYGVNLYGDAILVNAKFAAANPEAVKAFLQGYLRGLKETIRSPAAAVDSVVRRNEGARKEIELERLQIALKQNIVTQEVKQHGFGDIDPTRLEASFDLIAITHAFKARPKTADVFNPSFLPAPVERRADAR